MDFPQTLTEHDKDILTLSPVLVFVLLAATAGEASDAQRQAFVAILKGAEVVPSKTLAAALSFARKEYEPLRKSLAGRRIDPAAELARIKEVLDSGRLMEDEAEAFGHGLFFIAESVAKAGAKKRLFGLLGRKIPVGNREVVTLVHGVFVA